MNEPRVHAPQLPANPKLWLNTGGKAVSLADLRGQVVLLDFWTYSGINCLHVLPDLNYLETKYADSPFVVIGVHAGKFDNEKDNASIRNALLRYGIRHPVVQDDDHKLWQAYDVHAWPTFVLIDPEGYCVGSVSGEGHRAEMDQFIGQLLAAYEVASAALVRALRFAPEGAQIEDTPLSYPGKVLTDTRHERLFIADTGHNRVVICGLDGSSPQIIGSGEGGHADGAVATARFSQPQGMALVGDLLFVCDCGSHRLRRIDLVQQTVTTVAGTGEQGKPRAPGGVALKTALASPWDVCYNPTESGALYVAMAGTHQIWRYDLRDGDIVPYAGSGREARIDGADGQAAFAQPSGIATNGKYLFVTDSESSSIRRVTPGEDASVETLAGGDLFAWGDVDGEGDAACFQHPLGVTWHGDRVYIADTFNHKIKMLNPLTREVTTLAGAGPAGLANGTPDTAQFDSPGGLSGAAGKLYVADTNNHSIRTLDLQTGMVSTLELAGVGFRI